MANFARVIRRTPVVGEILHVRFYSAARIEEYRCEVLAASAAVCRVRVIGGGTVRVHVSQILEQE